MMIVRRCRDQAEKSGSRGSCGERRLDNQRTSKVTNPLLPHRQKTAELSLCGMPRRQADTYVDEGISGSEDSRPELNRLMTDAHKRRFDVVCVWRFDRFARSVSHLLRALETFKALGIDFVSFSEQMDTSTPAGKMVFTVLGAVAELERSLIVERVRAGMRNARAKGRNGGLSLANVVRLNIYTTDVDGLLAHNDVIKSRLAAVGCQPSSTLLGVKRLAYPELLIEIEATAAE